LQGAIQRLTGPDFPWGTMVVNVLGAFVIGVLWELADQTNLSFNVKAFLFIGVLGGFTTFSSYTIESLNLYRNGQPLWALWNVAGSNVLCLVMAAVGVFAARGMLALAK
jgi:CrcB protein